MNRKLTTLVLTLSAMLPLAAAAKPVTPPKPHVVVTHDHAPKPHVRPVSGHK